MPQNVKNQVKEDSKARKQDAYQTKQDNIFVRLLGTVDNGGLTHHEDVWQNGFVLRGARTGKLFSQLQM
jgi:hypothetical protein